MRLDERFAAVLVRVRPGEAPFFALGRAFAPLPERPFAVPAERPADAPAFRPDDFLMAGLAGFAALRLIDRFDDLLAVFFAFDGLDAIGLRDFFFAMRELL